MYNNTTLGHLIGFLEKLDPEKRVKHGFGAPHSDRGYYEELAFDPEENVKIGDMLRNAKSANGHTFDGWKGGKFTMSIDTPVYIGKDWQCGDAITPFHFATWAEQTLQNKERHVKYRDKGRLQPPKAQGGEEIYNPPAWRVCPICDGAGELSIDSTGSETKECYKCHGTGRIPIRYTPDEWREAGGMLSSDTQVWFKDKAGALGLWHTDNYFGANDKDNRWGDGVYIIIAIPGQPSPPVDWRPKEEQHGT